MIMIKTISWPSRSDQPPIRRGIGTSRILLLECTTCRHIADRVSASGGNGMRVRSLVIAVALLGACEPREEPRRPAPGSASETLTPWPFTVDRVELSCEAPSRVFVTTLDGRRFAVNGAARSDAPLMREIQGYYDASALIERGLRICESGGAPLQLIAPRAADSTPAPPPAPTFTVEASQLGGIIASAEANSTIDGHLPTLSFSCDGGAATRVSFDLIRAPQTPPPLRGVYGTFQVDDLAPRRVEVSWGGPRGRWMIRSDDASSVEAELVPVMLSGQQVTFIGPSGFTTGEPVVWAMTGFGDHLLNLRDVCG
jgi:hypothetical protein